MKHQMKCEECGEWNASLWKSREGDNDFKLMYRVSCNNNHGPKTSSKTEAEAWDAYFEKNTKNETLFFNNENRP